MKREDIHFSVQWVCPPQRKELHDFRGYMGQIESGSARTRDAVTVLPLGLSSLIKEILICEGYLTEAFAPQSVTLTIEDHSDISRGDMLVKKSDTPRLPKR